MNKNYYPKGSLCKACVNNHKDCSNLDFRKMRVIVRDGADNYVKCDLFSNKKVKT